VTSVLDQMASPALDAGAAYAEFRSALLDFFEISTAQNFRRYQAASRALAAARRSNARAALPELQERSRRRRSAPER
jgi:hypothetical protein